MITGWEIYLITRLDAILVFATVLTVAGGIVGVTWGIIGAVEVSDLYDGETKKAKWKAYRRYFVNALIVWAIPCCVVIMTPSTKQAVAIYLIPNIANNEQIQKIPGNAATLLNAKLEAWIDDFRANKKDEK
jgi:hypothetical protein